MSSIGTAFADGPCANLLASGGGGLAIQSTGGGTMTDSTVSGNGGVGNGGGILYLGGTAPYNVVRSTISLNNMTTGTGGAAHVGAGTLNLTNSTVSTNGAGGADGISSFGTLNFSSATVTGHDVGVTTFGASTSTFENTLVDDACSNSGTHTSLGHNLEFGVSCGFTDVTDQQDADPQLGPLTAANGGPTATHALGPGSDAIDEGECDGLATDQRGVPRPQGGICDVGAFESTPPSATVTFPTAALTTANYLAGCGTTGIQDICGTAAPNGNFGDDVALVEVSIQRSDNFHWDGTGFINSGVPIWNAAAGTTSWSYAFAPGSDGVFTVNVRATDEDGYVGLPTTQTFTLDNVAPAAPVVQSSISKRKNKATFSFTGEAGATFECSLDGRAFAPCTSPKTYRRLKERRHTFQVKAIDAAGNRSTATTVTFRV